MEQVNVFIIISTYLFLLRAKLMQTATGAAVSICSSNNAARFGAHHSHERVKRGAMDGSIAHIRSLRLSFLYTSGFPFIYCLSSLSSIQYIRKGKYIWK